MVVRVFLRDTFSSHALVRDLGEIQETLRELGTALCRQLLRPQYRRLHQRVTSCSITSCSYQAAPPTSRAGISGDGGDDR